MSEAGDRPENERRPEEEDDFRHWGLVYTAVVIFTVATIAALWLFSLVFTP